VTFHLSVINPNSDKRVTDHLSKVCRQVLAGAEVEAVDCAGAPAVIETALDSVLAAPAILRSVLRAPGADAYLIGCFGDPAVAALRELTDKPVVGLGEAALIEASLVTSRFGLLTTLERGTPALWAQLQAAGKDRACAGIRSVESAPQPSGEDPGDDLVLSLLLHQGRLLLDDGADGIVLACAAFGRLRDRLARTLDVPVCDGIGLGACLARGLHAVGATTSKRGAYATPEASVLALYRGAGGALADEEDGYVS
jgi:allantoin racemase